MARRLFSREFKVEAVRLVRERGVSVAQAARDLDLHENMLRRWVKELTRDPAQAFPGQGQLKPDHLEVERLRRRGPSLRAQQDDELTPRIRASFVARRPHLWRSARLARPPGGRRLLRVPQD